ncbi:hypothetical protein [Halomarina litorea]|uniref:hypothetical protein n=1 Tax=Halomarina litorea TaxID=2961595 RepID=UPI0020C25C53|nr:hypothetical protein [Halomarina sp. BCD28]
MEFTVLGDLVARERRGGTPALSVPGSGREYDYRRFCTTTWKVAHFLAHLGVRAGRPVAVAADPAPEPVLTCYGAALLGAPVEFFEGDPPDDARAVVVPTGAAEGLATVPGRKRVGYGDAPDDPDVAHFERDVWSENPTEPPDRVTPDRTLLRSASGTHDHRTVLAAASRVAEGWSLGPGDRVVVRAPLTRPGTVAAGLVAPVLSGGVVVFPDDDTVGEFAVGDGESPEPTTLAPGAVL